MLLRRILTPLALAALLAAPIIEAPSAHAKKAEAKAKKVEKKAEKADKKAIKAEDKADKKIDKADKKVSKASNGKAKGKGSKAYKGGGGSYGHDDSFKRVTQNPDVYEHDPSGHIDGDGDWHAGAVK